MSNRSRETIRKNGKNLFLSPFNRREAASHDLILAAFICDERGVRLSLEEGADTDIKDISGLTPLILVLSHNGRKKYQGLLSCLTMLLEHGADVNCSDRKGRTPCHVVCSNDQIERGDRFAALKLLVNFKPMEELLERSSYQVRSEVKLSMTEPSKDLWESGLVEISLPTLGLHRKNTEPVRMSRLSRRPMNMTELTIDQDDGEDKRPPDRPRLVFGQSVGNFPKEASLYNISLELARSNSTSKNVRNFKWRNRFTRYRASSAELADDKKVNQACNINKADSGWRTPLLDASQHGFSEGIRFLIDMRADVNARTRTGQTPLHRAVWGLHIDCIDALLSAGCDMNAQDNSGNTLLHLLAINAKNRIEHAFIDLTLEVLKMVVELDEDTLNERKSYIMQAVGETLEYLRIEMDELIIALIADYTAVTGADLRTKNNQNVSAYGIAARLANKQQCSRKIAKALKPRLTKKETKLILSDT